MSGSDGGGWWSPPWVLGSADDPDAGWAATPNGGADGWGVPDVSREGEAAEIVAVLEAEYAQVRSRDRVRDLAEVFTHRREVDAMLDLIPDAFTGVDVKFLEPACGSGNFLVAILRRKLALVSAAECVSQEVFEFRMLRAAASLYGVDISPENVTEARARCGHLLLEHFQSDANTADPSPGFLSAAVHIVGHNIVQGDTINAAHDVELCDWQPHPGGRFVRVWSAALVPEGERDLFWAERVQDEAPVHYSELADEPAGKPERGTGRRR